MRRIDKMILETAQLFEAKKPVFCFAVIDTNSEGQYTISANLWNFKRGSLAEDVFTCHPDREAAQEYIDNMMRKYPSKEEGIPILLFIDDMYEEEYNEGGKEEKIKTEADLGNRDTESIDEGV